jgi:hypothetical protein
MCAIDDAEPWTVVDTRQRKARKAHRCSECGRTIRQRETYSHTKGMADDYWRQYRTCRHCAAASVWLQIACGGYPFTMLIDELDKHALEHLGSEVLPELLTSIRDGWSDGEAPLPPVVDLEADAQRCLGELVSP